MPSASETEWTRVNPVGSEAQPGEDHTPGIGEFAFVTGQGALGAAATQNDVDGGKTTLVTPPIDVSMDPEGLSVAPAVAW